MNSTKDKKHRSSSEKGNTPLVLHLRRHRFWHGEQRLRQAELAALAGVSTRQLRDYEQARRLPRCLATLLSLSVVLNVTVEDLVARHVLDAIKARVNDSRAKLEAKRQKHKHGCRSRP
jgi:DNA-binding transcriptional regulator YiaG